MVNVFENLFHSLVSQNIFGHGILSRCLVGTLKVKVLP